MLLTEYDYATDMEVQREEAMRIGEERGIEQGIEQGLQQGEYQKALEAAKKSETIRGFSGHYFPINRAFSGRYRPAVICREFFRDCASHADACVSFNRCRQYNT